MSVVKDMFRNPVRYRKFFVGLVGAVLTWALSTYPDNHDVQVYASLVSALLTAAGVYQVSNEE